MDSPNKSSQGWEAINHEVGRAAPGTSHGLAAKCVKVLVGIMICILEASKLEGFAIGELLSSPRIEVLRWLCLAVARSHESVTELHGFTL